jgi:putative restriction endonuclease
LPIHLAWDIFGNKNGFNNYHDFYNTIGQLRNPSNPLEANPNVGCIVLTNPVFFKPEDWIPWELGAGIMQGKSYNSDLGDGKILWDRVQSILIKYQVADK